MRKLFLALSLLGSIVQAAGVQINGNQINPATAITIATMTVTGATGLAVTTNISAGTKVVSPQHLDTSGQSGILVSPTETDIYTGGILRSKVTSAGLQQVLGNIISDYGVTAATGTITGNSFSVGTSTFVVIGGRVGINTASPTVVFQASTSIVRFGDVNGTDIRAYNGSSDVGAFDVSPTGSTMTFYVGGATSGDVKMSILNNGRVGIGTTTPGAPLDVQIAGAGGNSVAFFLQPALSDSARMNIRFGQSTASKKSGFAVFNLGTSGASYNDSVTSLLNSGDTFGTQSLNLLVGGNVGISTASPRTKLELSSTAPSPAADSGPTIAQTTLLLADIAGNSNSASYIGLGYSAGTTYAPASIGYQQTGNGGVTNGDLNFFTRNTGTDVVGQLNMKISAAGKVTIGSGGTPLTLISTGTYTPTATSGSNVTTSLPGIARFQRVGNIVTVTGNTDITTTSPTSSTILGLSIPIASAFTSLYDAQGVMSNGGNSGYGVVYASSTATNRIFLQFVNVTATNTGYNYSYMYEIK